MRVAVAAGRADIGLCGERIGGRRIQTGGARGERRQGQVRSFAQGHADSDTSWTDELACHARESGIFLSILSLCC